MVVEELDRRAPDGRSGVTTSMLSGWERGRHVTSMYYRQMLCTYYGEPSGMLFAHQDQVLTSKSEVPRLLARHDDMGDALRSVVQSAEEYLVVTGSRSRDVPYLAEIEDQLARRPRLVHYRVLFGPPHHAVLKEHLRRLLGIRDPLDRSEGFKTLHLGLVEDTTRLPERFLCASEREAIVPIPSLTSAEAFDSGVRLGPRAAERLIDHVRQCYAGAVPVETPAVIDALDVLHDSDVRKPRRHLKERT